jgi:hypothetical protein
MTTSLSKKSRYQTILLIAGSLLIVAGAAFGTIFLLKQYGPDKVSNTTEETTANGTSSLKKAEALFSKGDYAGAKTQYQSILQDYKAQKNETAAADIEMQLKVIDATAQAEKAPQNTDRNRVIVGSKPE